MANHGQLTNLTGAGKKQKDRHKRPRSTVDDGGVGTAKRQTGATDLRSGCRIDTVTEVSRQTWRRLYRWQRFQQGSGGRTLNILGFFQDSQADGLPRACLCHRG